MMKYKKTNDNSIAAFVNGKSYAFSSESANYDKIDEALRNQDEEQFMMYVVDEDNLNKFCDGYIQFNSGIPTWEGVPMPDIFTDRILSLVRDGQEFYPMINFAANLAENPSDNSILELVEFLRNKYLPITPDGCFLAYKVVGSDYKDLYSGTIDNSIGSCPSVDRSEVDDDRTRECSHGLHVGAIEYVQWYGGLSIDRLEETDRKVIIVKVHPKDVVSVPRDHSFQKLRCCRYEVVSNFKNVIEDSVCDETIYFNEDKLTVNSEPRLVEATSNPGWVDTLKSKLSRVANLIKGSMNA